MKKAFSTEFYKKLYDRVYDECEKRFENPDNEPSVSMTVEIEFDDCTIEADVEVTCEFEDRSFDHAFGTWHDPYAGYVFGDVDIISGKVYDDDGNVYEFDVEAYDSQFMSDHKGGIVKGDKVGVIGRYGNVLYEAEFIAYDTHKSESLVKFTNSYGKVVEKYVKTIRKALKKAV